MIWYRLANEPLSSSPAVSPWGTAWETGSAIVPLESGNSARAWVSSLNPLAQMPPNAQAPGAVVVRSGWSTSDRPAWMPGGREALDRFLRACPAGGEVWLWPAADHVLSDVPSIVGFLRRHAESDTGPRVRLLFDPASLLAPSMLPRAGDHLARMFEALAAHPATAAIVLANVVPGSDLEGSRLTAWHAGAIGARVLAERVREFAPPASSVVLIDERLDEQIEALVAHGLRPA